MMKCHRSQPFQIFWKYISLFFVSMLLCAITATAQAAAGDVARIGTTQYASLQAALDTITGTDTATIELLDNVTSDVVIDGKNVVIDLGGFTLTAANTADIFLT